MKMSPDVGERRPLHNFSKVDFPAPEGPVIVVIFPSGNDPVMFFNIVVSLTVYVTFLKCMAGLYAVKIVQPLPFLKVIVFLLYER